MKEFNRIQIFVFSVLVISIVISSISFLITAGQVAGIVHVWEDGSWGIGKFPYPVSGCLPNRTCGIIDINLFGVTIPLEVK